MSDLIDKICNQLFTIEGWSHKTINALRKHMTEIGQKLQQVQASEALAVRQLAEAVQAHQIAQAASDTAHAALSQELATLKATMAGQVVLDADDKALFAAIKLVPPGTLKA